jgi:hypothetical protein
VRFLVTVTPASSLFSSLAASLDSLKLTVAFTIPLQPFGTVIPVILLSPTV